MEITLSCSNKRGISMYFCCSFRHFCIVKSLCIGRIEDEDNSALIFAVTDAVRSKRKCNVAAVIISNAQQQCSILLIHHRTLCL